MNTRCGFVRILAVAVWIMAVGTPSYAQSAETRILRVSGSDNVARFVSIYAEDYMTAHPDVNIVVVGGKTSSGLRGLSESRAELAMASRKITSQEEETFRQKGIRLTERQVGWCSIVVVIHPSTPVGNLDKDQLAKIFKGDYANWKELGGPDQAITVVVVEDPEDDATRFFAEHVLSGTPYTKTTTVVAGIHTVLPKVLETEGSIGFCRVTDLEYRTAKQGSPGHGAGHGGLPKILGIKAHADAPAVLPPTHHDHSTAATGHGDLYPIRYPLYVYYSEGTGPLGGCRT